MNYLVERLFNIGVSEKDSLSKKRVTRMVNQAAVIAVFFCIIAVVINIATGFYLASLIPLLSGLFFVLVPYFNFIGKYTASKLMLTGVGYVATTLVVSIVDLNTYTFYYFISVFATTIVFFPYKKDLWKTLLVSFLCIGSSLFISYNNLLPKISIANPFFFGVLNVFLLIFILYVLMYSLIQENNIFQTKTDGLLASINEKNRELTLEKSKVEATAKNLLQTNAHLEQEILEREKIEGTLRESNELLRQFAYIASHDMKEPLRTIGSFSGLLARKLKGKLAEDEEEYLNFITDGVSRMSVLLDDLLKYASLSNPVTYEEVNLNDTLQVVKNSLNNLLHRKNVEIEIGKLPTLMASQSQLLQLFQNLVSNGIKFNDKPNPKIQIDCTENKLEYKFSVKDNGIGIPAESQTRIWKIFDRLHSKAEFEGSGIGLAVVQKVVSNHQGQIWLDSTENVGTTFYFTIAKNLCPASAEITKLQESLGEEVSQN